MKEPGPDYEGLAGIFRDALARLPEGSGLATTLRDAARARNTMVPEFESVSELMMRRDFPLAQAALRFPQVFDPVLRELALHGTTAGGRDFLVSASEYCAIRVEAAQSPSPGSERRVFLLTFARALEYGVPLSMAMSLAAGASPETFRDQVAEMIGRVAGGTYEDLPALLSGEPFDVAHMGPALDLGFTLCVVDVIVRAVVRLDADASRDSGDPIAADRVATDLHERGFPVRDEHRRLLQLLDSSTLQQIAEAARRLPRDRCGEDGGSRATSCRAEGDTERAVLELAAAVEHARLGDLAAAHAACRRAEALGASAFAASKTRGDVLRLAGDLDAAIDAYIIAAHAECSPTAHAAAIYEVADAYEASDRQEQALYYFQLLARGTAVLDDVRGSPAARARRLTGIPDEPA